MRRKPPFSDRLHEGVILTDGAMGTYLHTQGVPLDRCFAELCLSEPRQIEAIHREYVVAGAEILGTNSYGANALQLDRVGLGDQVRKINIAAARLARQASEGQCYVAGVVGPLGAALAPLGPITRVEAIALFREQIDFLVEGGVDYIAIETISDLEEFGAALDAAASCELPLVIHKTFTEDGTTLMGELPHEVVARAEAGSAIAVGANCTVGPQRMVDIIARMSERAEIPLAAMPTAGLPRLVDGTVQYHAEPGYMARYAVQLAEAGATIIGACCGATPAHIAAMASALAETELTANQVAVAVSAAPAKALDPIPAPERSALAARLGSSFVTAVDIELPRGHDLDEVEDYGRDLVALGVDTLVLSDALRARLFLHPLVAAEHLQTKLDIECVLPFHTRDKNVLGIQSDLLAAHVMGVRNLFVSLSEPANLGDYPSTRTLSDVGSQGLVRILNAMNQGLDLAENTIGDPTAFVPLISGDPAAGDRDAELARIAQGVAAGALGVVTPPQFDIEAVVDFVAGAGPGVPVIVGVLPLRSAEHAEYLHNEVPGIHVPKAVREELARAADERDTGVRLAGDLLEALPGVAAGAHVVPPYRKRDRALAALEAMRLDAAIAAGAREV